MAAKPLKLLPVSSPFGAVPWHPHRLTVAFEKRYPEVCPVNGFVSGMWIRRSALLAISPLGRHGGDCPHLDLPKTDSKTRICW